jgi:hypothetical protein
MSALVHAEQEDVKQIALRVAGGEGSSLQRAQRLLQWMHETFEWTENDYAPRTVEEILERRAGHCGEMAWVLKALLEAANLDVRVAKEINIHPRSKQRMRDAEKLIAEHGHALSVFGYAHNDHRWLELYDEASDSWIPADPTLGVLGTKQWIDARLGFHQRPAAAAALIAPFVVLAERSDGTMEDRSSHYLVQEFNSHFGSKLEDLPSWPAWTELIDQLSTAAQSAFVGEVNLHHYTHLMERVEQVYFNLKAEFLSASQGAR